MTQLKAGDTVYVVDLNEGRVYYVHSVGRKLAKIRIAPKEYWTEELMELDTWLVRDQRKGFGCKAKAYRSEAEYLEKSALKKAWEVLVSGLSRYKPPQGMTIASIAELREEFGV